ncbi:hypothetical protein IGI04_027050, partial [Brassica rapa subsp. trilocularis]
GVKIQASCKQSLFQLFQRHCRVGEWKVITNFSLSPVCGLYRHTNHVYKIEFMSQTLITDSNLHCDNMFLELKQFDNIKNGSHDTSFLIDVIGEVLDFGGLDIVQYAKLKNYKGIVPLICKYLFNDQKLLRELQVSNAFDSSLVLQNPDIKEAQALKNMQGVKIQASCKQSLFQLFQRHCRVGEWKVITNFSLSPVCGLYRHTNHVYKIEFMSQTLITDSNLHCDNMFLELKQFDNIKNGSHDTSFLIDVIGEVLDFGGLDIVQYAKLGNYKGELQVSNAFDSSLVLLNPDIKEAQALKNMQGVKIQASCKQSLFQLFQRHCRVGEWKVITNFSLSPTLITDSNLHCDNMFLELKQFDNIKNGSHDTSFLIGELQVSNAFDSSLVLLNPDIKEAQALKNMQGVKIQASCKQSLFQLFQRHCRVGEWKVITNFSLSPVCGLYRHTNHVYKIEFMSQTLITDSNLHCDNMFLELKQFDNIKNGSHDTSFLIGELQVSNAFDSSLVLLNPDIKEAQTLKNMQPKHDNVMIQEKRQKWSQFPFKTIQEMKRTDK